VLRLDRQSHCLAGPGIVNAFFKTNKQTTTTTTKPLSEAKTHILTLPFPMPRYHTTPTETSQPERGALYLEIEEYSVRR